MINVKDLFNWVRNRNPKPVLEAVVKPADVPLAKFALLERANCPVLYRDISILTENVRATYLYSLPMEEAVKHVDTSADDSLVWLDKVGTEEYNAKFAELVHAVCRFWDMMPTPEKKKTEKTTNSETGGLEN